jgi:hypothetical protein
MELEQHLVLNYPTAAGVPRSGVNPRHSHPGYAGVGVHLRRLAQRLALQGAGRPVSLVREPPQPDEPCPRPIVPQLTWRRYWMEAKPGS